MLFSLAAIHIFQTGRHGFVDPPGSGIQGLPNIRLVGDCLRAEHIRRRTDPNLISRFQAAEKAAKFILEENSDTVEIPLLKQAILQEAIQGNLTADWRAANPDVEPASKLLKRIQAEKAQLIKSNKIKQLTARKLLLAGGL